MKEIQNAKKIRKPLQNVDGIENIVTITTGRNTGNIEKNIVSTKKYVSKRWKNCKNCRNVEKYRKCLKCEKCELLCEKCKKK